MSVLDIPDLEAAYLLDETSGTTAVDSSGNGVYVRFIGVRW